MDEVPEKEDPLQWWVKRKGDYPNMWRMAKDLLPIPATSSPAERVFSRAANLYSKYRNRLKGDTAQALMNLGSWWGGEGLPGVQVPDIMHPKVELPQKKKLKLPLVLINNDGNAILEEINDWDEEISDSELEDEGGDDDDWEDEMVYSNVGLQHVGDDVCMVEGDSKVLECASKDNPLKDGISEEDSDEDEEWEEDSNEDEEIE